MERPELCTACSKQCKLRNALQLSDAAKQIESARESNANRVSDRVKAGEFSECTQVKLIIEQIDDLNPNFDTTLIAQSTSEQV